MPQSSVLANTARRLLILILTAAVLYFGKSFLVPLAFAAIFAMLLTPLSKRLEKKGTSKAAAILLCILLMLLAVTAIISLLGWQLSGLMSDISNIEQRFRQFLGQIAQYISDTLGIDIKKQEEIVKEQAKAASSGSAGTIAAVSGAVLGFFVNFILVLVYIFLFMYFRSHLKKFLLKITPADQKQNVNRLVIEAAKVSQQYLTGLALMIVSLWILYGIGFSIAGVKHALFFAVLCGMLEIVPFVGNLTGTMITVTMGLMQGGDLTLILGIIVTYGSVQFIQTYLLEPLVVGREVNINPLFTIIGIVAGEALWGIPGMVLAIPIIGITKIVCDHFEPLKPYGFLLGQEKKPGKTNHFKKIKSLIKPS